jgi:hypothetical protein
MEQFVQYMLAVDTELSTTSFCRVQRSFVGGESVQEQPGENFCGALYQLFVGSLDAPAQGSVVGGEDVLCTGYGLVGQNIRLSGCLECKWGLASMCSDVGDIV